MNKDQTEELREGITNIWNFVYVPGSNVISLENNIKYYNTFYKIITNNDFNSISGELHALFNSKLSELYINYYNGIRNQIEKSIEEKQLSLLIIKEINLCNTFNGFLENTFCFTYSTCGTGFSGSKYTFKIVNELLVKKHITPLCDELKLIIIYCREQIIYNRNKKSDLSQIMKYCNKAIRIADAVDELFLDNINKDSCEFYKNKPIVKDSFIEYVNTIYDIFAFENYILKNVNKSSYLLEIRSQIIGSYVLSIHNFIFADVCELVTNGEYQKILDYHQNITKAGDRKELKNTLNGKTLLKIPEETVIDVIKKNIIHVITQKVSEYSVRYENVFEFYDNVILYSKQIMTNLPSIISNLSFMSELMLEDFVKKRGGITLTKFASLYLNYVLLNSTTHTIYEKLNDYFDNVFKMINEYDVFIENYLKILQKRILHQNVFIGFEELVYYHLLEKIPPCYSLYKYQMIYNEMLKIPPMWENGLILSYFTWSSTLGNYEKMTYDDIIQKTISEYSEFYNCMFEERIIYWDGHYTMCDLKIELNEKEYTIVLSIIGANVLMNGIKNGFENPTRISKETNVSLNAVNVWITQFKKQNVVRSSDNGFPGLFYDLKQYTTIIVTPAYEKCKYGITDEVDQLCVIEKRPEIVDAYVVGIMKKHTELHRNTLYHELRNKLRLFSVSEEDFEKCVGKLVSKDYLEYRSDENVYVYVP